MVEEGKDPEGIVSRNGLAKVEDESMIKGIIKKIIKANRTAVDDYTSGGEKALDFLVGQVMRESKGKIDPRTARALIMKEVKSRK